MSFGYIYGLVDPNDNVIKYVGQTKFPLKKRLKEHIRNANYSKTKKQRLYIWLGKILDCGETPIIIEIEKVKLKELNNREKYWIDHYKKFVLNVTKGGSGINFIESRKFTNEHRKKIGDSCRGNKHYNYKKMANNVKSVLQYDVNGYFIKEYKSINIAANENNIKRSGISQCLSRKRHTCGNYIWISGDDENKERIIKETINKIKKFPNNNLSSIKIVQLDIDDNFIKEYNSIKEAARLNKCSDVSITYACRKSKTNLYKGYKWVEKKSWIITNLK